MTCTTLGHELKVVDSMNKKKKVVDGMNDSRL